MPVRAYKKRMPVVSVRGLAVIPGMIIHFDIVNDVGIRAIEHAMVQKDQHVFIVMLKDTDADKSEEEELYPIGCIASVKQVLKLPNKTIRVLVEGVRRADLLEIYEEDGYRMGVVRPVVLDNADSYEDETDPERVALIQSFMETMREYLQYNPKVEKILSKCKVTKMPFADLMDVYAAHLPMTAYDRQRLLESRSERERAVIFCTILENEINILKVRKNLQEQVRERVDKNQKEYIGRSSPLIRYSSVLLPVPFLPSRP